MNEQILFNKYQVQRKIASGGMGTIYLATDTKLGREVAIKVLHPQYSGETAFAQRFLREARAMAKLDHPNIIRIWSVEEEKASHCIVMEYFPGNDLKHLIRDRGSFSIKDALSYITQIIQGLTYAHSMGIIHRDIKPANILVNQEGKVKITDFGIAAAFNESSLTLDGSVIGTPEYMAPEQARAEPIGPSTDLYSAGILLYELLTGQTPYKGIPAQTVISLLAFDPTSTSLTFSSEIPTELRVLILKLTKKEMESRLQDPEEILQLIQSIQQENHPFLADPAATALLPPEIASNIGDSISSPTTRGQSLPSKNQGEGPSSHALGNSKASQNRKRIFAAIGVLVIAAIIVLTLSQWKTTNLPTPEKRLQTETLGQSNEQGRGKSPLQITEKSKPVESSSEKELQTKILSQSNEEERRKPTQPITEKPKPIESSPKPNKQIRELPNTVNSLDKEIAKLFDTFEASAQNFNSRLSTVQSEIQTIQNEDSSAPNVQARVKDLQDQIEVIGKDIEGLYKQSTNQKQQFQHTLDATVKKYHQLVKEGLGPDQKAQLHTLDEILKKTQNRLNEFPPPSWNQLPALSHTIQTDIAKIDQDIEQASQAKAAKAQQIEDVTQQASQLKKDLQDFRSKTLAHFQDLTQEADTYATQIASPDFLTHKENVADIVTTFHNSLEDLKASSLQQSTLYAQRVQFFSQRQKDILEQEKNFTQSSFASSFQPQLSTIRTTLQSLEHDLQDLQRVNWKELTAKIGMTMTNLNQAHESLKQARLQRKQSLQAILDDFSSAYINQDIVRLKLLTSMSKARLRNLDLMFNIYSDIDMHIKILSIADSQATAKMFIDKLITKEGKTIMPNAIIRETALTIPQKDGEWGKIQW